mmetsp:Transcript_2899/g.9612  ORF Transcript_2899/g.9612 Transcript_2899/m.9612 type:complete len:208 (-) Transcript_2899:1059-1682(-)
MSGVVFCLATSSSISAASSPFFCFIIVVTFFRRRRRWSRVNSATKKVSCMAKSIMTEIAQKRQKAAMSGMRVIEPARNATKSVTDVTAMEGPEDRRVLTTRRAETSSTDSTASMTRLASFARADREGSYHSWSASKGSSTAPAMTKESSRPMPRIRKTQTLVLGLKVRPVARPKPKPAAVDTATQRTAPRPRLARDFSPRRLFHSAR